MVVVIRFYFFFWIMFFTENIGIKAYESQFEKISTCIFFAIIKVKTGPTDPSNLQGLIHLYFLLELYCIFIAFTVKVWLICLYILIQVTTSAFRYPLPLSWNVDVFHLYEVWHCSQLRSSPLHDGLISV